MPIGCVNEGVGGGGDFGKCEKGHFEFQTPRWDEKDGRKTPDTFEMKIRYRRSLLSFSSVAPAADRCSKVGRWLRSRHHK